uniref:Uncharacterized protein n=1 Tax=Clastoptera arizonana TaxID=38151 RepID=A0A1B6CXK8_9HEMI
MFLIFVIILQLWILSNSQSINVKYSGILPLKAQDMAMVFYVTAENEDTSATAASVRLEMIKCCEKLPNDDLGCDTIELLPFSGPMTSATLSNYTLIYPTVYPYQRSGVCTVDVSLKQGGGGKVCLKTKIHFDTIFSKRKNSEILKDYFCANKVMKCRSRDLDPLDHCKPVDCYKKYSGRKSYFDKTTATCKAIPKCLPKTGSIVTYDVSENACKVTSPSISEDDLTDVEMKTKKCTETSRRLFLHSG